MAIDSSRMDSRDGGGYRGRGGYNNYRGGGRGRRGRGGYNSNRGGHQSFGNRGKNYNNRGGGGSGWVEGVDKLAELHGHKQVSASERVYLCLFVCLFVCLSSKAI